MITINDIYLYVLQPIKAIKMPTEDELQSIAAQSSKPIEDIKASKIKQIKQHQTKITEIFTPYRANPKLRAFLRISGAHQLEDLLFNLSST